MELMRKTAGSVRRKNKTKWKVELQRRMRRWPSSRLAVRALTLSPSLVIRHWVRFQRHVCSNK